MKNTPEKILEEIINGSDEEIGLLDDEEFPPLKDEHDEHYLRQGHNRSLPKNDGSREYEELVDAELSDDEFLKESEEKYKSNYKGSVK